MGSGSPPILAPSRSLLLALALARAGLAGECPVASQSLPKKFKVVQKIASFNDEYTVEDMQGTVEATMYDSIGFPKEMTLHNGAGDVWATGAEDPTSGELSFYDCAGGLIARLKKPSTGTVIQDRNGNNVAEIGSDGCELSMWSSHCKVILSAEPEPPALANEAGQQLAILVQERPGAGYEVTVEIIGEIWHHTPQGSFSDGPTTTKELVAAGRLLASKANSSGEDPQDGNPALDPAVLAIFASAAMGDSHYFFGGKLLMELMVLLVLVCVLVCICCCVARLAKRDDKQPEESYIIEDDYDSDTEREKNWGPLSCCSSRRPTEPYKTLPRAP